VLYEILLHRTVQRLINPPPLNLVSEILIYDGVETMEAVIKILWFIYLVHHPVFLLITHDKQWIIFHQFNLLAPEFYI